jgi:hypothetical protein
MSSSAELGGCGVTTRLLGLAAAGLTLAGAFLVGLTVAALVASLYSDRRVAISAVFGHNKLLCGWSLVQPIAVQEDTTK